MIASQVMQQTIYEAGGTGSSLAKPNQSSEGPADKLVSGPNFDTSASANLAANSKQTVI